jgi:phage terminase large subunit GpA-like protein
MLNEAYNFFLPKEDLTPVEFNEKYTFIPSEVSGYSGFFNPKFNRYICEPLNASADTSINEIICMWGSQTGKSFLLSAIALSRIAQKNSSLLYVMPSDHQAKQLVRERFLPLMKSNKKVAELFPEDEDLITLHNIKMKNCNLHFNGCTPSKLAGFSCPVVILDESEKFDIRSKLEASAPELAKQRIKSFSKAEQLFILSSTPTIEADDMSNIHYHYTRSDQRHYYIKCLKCGKDAKINFAENKTDFFIKFENKKFEDGKRDMNTATKTARLICPHCKAEFNDNEKNQMVNDESSYWKASNELADKQIRGYQLNSLYSHYVSLGDAVKTFLEGKESINGLRNFQNGFMGMPWKNKVIDAPDLVSLRYLECEYEKEELPKDSSFNLLIADVQKYHFYYMILSITTSGFIHIVDNAKASGFEMLKAEKERYNCEYALVDSRYNTSEIISELSELGKEWIAVRAFESLSNNVFHDIVLVDSVSGQKAKGGNVNKVNEFRINLAHYKSLVFRMRNRELPNLHIYKNFDYELAKHLLGEVQVEKMDKKGKKKIVFEALYPRIDYLDCLTYGVAWSYFLRGTKAYRNLDPNAKGTRKPVQDRIRKLKI